MVVKRSNNQRTRLVPRGDTTKEPESSSLLSDFRDSACNDSSDETSVLLPSTNSMDRGERDGSDRSELVPGEEGDGERDGERPERSFSSSALSLESLVSKAGDVGLCSLGLVILVSGVMTSPEALDMIQYRLRNSEQSRRCFAMVCSEARRSPSSMYSSVSASCSSLAAIISRHSCSELN